MNKWEELVNENVKELSDRLMETFNDGSIVHRFRVNHVDPVGYKVKSGIIVDYTLFVDLERIDREYGLVETETFSDVSLGSYFNSDPQKLVPFGKQYFDATSELLIEIVKKQFKRVVGNI